MIQEFLNKKSKSLEKLVGIVTVVYPLTALPQVYKIWIEKDVSGISFLTWFFFLILVIPLILYGIMKGEWKLVFMWGSWIIIYIVILTGLVIYG